MSRVRTFRTTEPLVMMTAEARETIAIAIKPHLQLAPDRTITGAIDVIEECLRQANLVHRWERTRLRAANRRKEWLEASTQASEMRRTLANLSVDARRDLLDIDAKRAGAGTPTVEQDELVRRYFAAQREPDRMTRALMEHLETWERRVNAIAATLANHREFKPWEGARRFLIGALREAFLSYNRPRPDAMTDRAWRQKQAAFIRAIFQHVGIRCPEKRDPIPAALRELDQR
jgi:hypothetical protein